MAEPDPHRTLQRQARALGERTRYRIFRYVAEAGRPVSLAEITSHVALHHNGVRRHLAKLCDADLLIEEFPAERARAAPPSSTRWRRRHRGS